MPDTPGPARPGAAFAEFIRKARTAAGLTQADLAFKAGVSLRLVTRWEAGYATNPQPDAVRAVCIALNVNPTAAVAALGYVTDDDLARAA